MITFYSMSGKTEENHKLLRHDFWEALACALKMSIVMIDRCGELLSRYNPFYPAAGQAAPSPLMTAFDEFYSRIPRMYTDLGKDQFLFDPLGMAASPVRLENGSYLLLGCRPGGRKLKRSKGSARPGGRKEPGGAFLNAHITPVAPEDMKECTLRIARLHTALCHCCSEPALPALLQAVDLLNELIGQTFDPGYFDLEAVLELIARFLAAFAGGGGAFAFSYEHPGRVLTPCCGEGVQIMTALADDWKSIARQGDPAGIFDKLVRERVEKEYASAFEGRYRRRSGASVYLGLIGAEGGPFQQALLALAKKGAAALGVSQLSRVLQYRWGTIFNSIKQGIIVVDSKGIITMMNRAAKQFFSQYGGTVPAEGRHFDRCNLDRRMGEALCIAARGNCNFMHGRSTLGDGDLSTYLHWDAVSLLREDGCSAGAILLFSDITEPVRIHHEVRDWERLARAGEVAAGLAHEIRNPLATAKAAIQLIRIFEDPAKQEELLVKLESEMDRMSAILTNFLSVTKPQPEERQKEVNLNDVIRELLFLLNSEALLNEIDLEYNLYTGDLPAVLGSPDSIKQVLLNIARNAIEVMEEGGKLSISTSLQNGWVHVTLQDNGPGIPAENMEMLTRPFFTTKPGGTGLGLYISSTIMKAMGGDLDIVSSPGQGTAVKLALPACESLM